MIEVVPGARIVLSALARGEPSQYPRLLLRTAGELRHARHADGAARRRRPRRPSTPIVAARAQAERIAAHGAAWPPASARVELPAEPLPFRVGRSRNQALVVDWAHEGVSGHHVDIVELDEGGREGRRARRQRRHRRRRYASAGVAVPLASRRDDASRTRVGDGAGMHADAVAAAHERMSAAVERRLASRATPASRRRRRRDERAPRTRDRIARQRSLKTRGVHLELAVASGRGKRHAVNEDSHSALDRPSPVYVVADGVGGGAMASWASRELVRRLHAALDRRRVDAGSCARRCSTPTAKSRARIAKHTDGVRRGHGGAVRGAGASAVAVADRLGRRLPRLSRARGARRAGGAADARRHLSAISARSRRRAARPTIRRAWSATARSPRRTWRASDLRRRRDARALQRRRAQACRAARRSIGSCCAAAACRSRAAARSLIALARAARQHRRRDRARRASRSRDTSHAHRRAPRSTAATHDPRADRSRVRARPPEDGDRRARRGVSRSGGAGRAAALHQALPEHDRWRLRALDRARMAHPRAPDRPRHRLRARRRAVRSRRGRGHAARADLRRRRDRRPMGDAAAGRSATGASTATCSRIARTGGRSRTTAWSRSTRSTSCSSCTSTSRATTSAFRSARRTSIRDAPGAARCTRCSTSSR